MASDLISLADALEFVVDNRGKTVPIENSGIALIATNCVSNDNLYPEHINVRYVSNEIYNNWFRSHPKPNDILLTNKGSKNGAICLVPDPVNFCIAQDMVALRADESKIDPAYLFAALRSQSIQSQIKQLNVDSVIPHFKKTDFDKLYIPLLSKDIQQHIGEIYLTFSKKIELNRQMNATLEAMAQALFKSWFVDFDPVIDNALAAGNAIPDEMLERAEQRKGIEKKDNSDIQHLFPDAFEFTEEMGWIPRGWEVKPLDEVAIYLNGLALQKYRPENIKDEYLPVVKIAQLREGLSNHDERASINIKPEYIIDNGDVIFSWSGSLLVDIWCGGKAALNQHLFKVTSDNYPKWFYLNYTKHHLAEFQRIATDKAVTMGHIKRGHLKEALCVIPEDGVNESVFTIFESILNKQISLRIENQTLTKLRDTLLPKLMSGELRIADDVL